jgi:hypothetical protein
MDSSALLILGILVVTCRQPLLRFSDLVYRLVARREDQPRPNGRPSPTKLADPASRDGELTTTREDTSDNMALRPFRRRSNISRPSPPRQRGRRCRRRMRGRFGSERTLPPHRAVPTPSPTYREPRAQQRGKRSTFSTPERTGDGAEDRAEGRGGAEAVKERTHVGGERFRNLEGGEVSSPW